MKCECECKVLNADCDCESECERKDQLREPTMINVKRKKRNWEGKAIINGDESSR